jgi:hypothetical protein
VSSETFFKHPSGQASPRKTMEIHHNAARTFKQDKERLNSSDGHWCRETFTQHYCTSAEVRKLLVIVR